jgi:hypothetical protein
MLLCDSHFDHNSRLREISITSGVPFGCGPPILGILSNVGEVVEKHGTRICMKEKVVDGFIFVHPFEGPANSGRFDGCMNMCFKSISRADRIVINRKNIIEDIFLLLAPEI